MQILENEQETPATLVVKGQTVEANLEKASNGNETVAQHHENDDATAYPSGIQFALISISLCLCVFLEGLVSRLTFDVQVHEALAQAGFLSDMASSALAGCDNYYHCNPAYYGRIWFSPRCGLV